MSRTGLVLLLVIALTGLMAADRATVSVGAQEATPSPATHPLVGTWVIRELAPPAGGPPVTAGLATFFADGNMLLSGFGERQAARQGGWSATGDRAALVTVVGLAVDESGMSDGTLERIRAAVEVDTAGDALQGGYTFDLIGPDGGVQFTYNGPVGGSRVEIEPPDPIALTLGLATPSAGTPEP